MRVGIIYTPIEPPQFDNPSDQIAHLEVIDTAQAISKVLGRKGHQVEIIQLQDTLYPELKNRFDFIFNLAEDTRGDILTESNVPGQLSRFEIPFSGSSKETLEICASKGLTKQIFIKNNLPTPNHIVIQDGRALDLFSQDSLRERNLRFPLIAKPEHTDGSLGIHVDSVVHTLTQLKEAVFEILGKMEMPALVEEYVEGREINATVIGNGRDLLVLPLSEMVFEFPPGVPRIHTYDSKWVKESALYDLAYGICPAELSEKTRRAIETISRHVYTLFRISDYGRIDFRLKDEVPFLIEVNPNPCLSPTDSPMIRSAMACGMNYDEIIDRIFRIAVERGENGILAVPAGP